VLETIRRNRGAKPLVWPPLIIGHRGAAGEAPENTLAAFELALRQGADGVELDVHLAADAVPVVIHDARLERTTSGRGRVGDHTLAALRRLDAGYWFNRRYPAKALPRYARLKIPTLAEALAWVRERNCRVYVEIKQGRVVPYPGIEDKVLEEIDLAGVRSRATVISFDLATLRRLRRLDSDLALGIDFTRPLLAVRRARALRATTLAPHWAFASRGFIRRAHRAGIWVLVWDLDQAAWMRRKISDGVDGIITRYPAKLAEIVASGQ
jgi:glycerophosphoryl diester phosphodiesterase